MPNETVFMSMLSFIFQNTMCHTLCMSSSKSYLNPVIDSTSILNLSVKFLSAMSRPILCTLSPLKCLSALSRIRKNITYVIFGYTGGWNPRIDMYIWSKGMSILVHSVGATNLSW